MSKAEKEKAMQSLQFRGVYRLRDGAQIRYYGPQHGYSLQDAHGNTVTTESSAKKIFELLEG